MTARGESNSLTRLCSGWRAAALLLLIGLAVYLPGLSSIPPVDRDESRFAQASRQMLEAATLPADQQDPSLHAGGLVVPRVAGTPRLNKPPLIYWLQSASAWAFTAGDPARDAIWMYRVPSVLGALCAAFITWRIARTMMSPPAALLAGALLAVCPIVVWDAHQARADQVLLACTTLAMGALWHIWSHRDRPAPGALARWGPPLILWTATGAGLMTKGVSPLIVTLAVVWLCFIARRWRWLARTKPILGLAILTLMVAPWVIAVGAQIGWSDYLSILFDETAGRAGGAKEGHWGPPGYHTVLSAALFWPGSLLTLAAFAAAWKRAGILAAPAERAPWRVRLASIPRRWRERTPMDDASLFLLAWLVPAWVFFELVSTKLPHYTMPLYPALALITARAIDDHLSKSKTAPAVPLSGLLIWALIGVAWVAAAPAGIALMVWGPVPAALIGAALAAVLLALAARRVRAGRITGAHAWAIGASVVFAITLLGVVLPHSRALWVSSRLADHLDPAAPVGAIGYHEDSLLFLTRGTLERLPDLSPPEAAAWLAAHPDHQLILPAELADALDPAPETVGNVRGFNYSTGDAVDLRIVRP